jgi:hypothetical protein
MCQTVLFEKTHSAHRDTFFLPRQSAHVPPECPDEKRQFRFDSSIRAQTDPHLRSESGHGTPDA